MMPRGTVHNPTGIIVVVGHDYVLDVDGGGRWRLELRDERKAALLRGFRVTVVGCRAGFDLLEVDTIEPAGPV